jgi:hypothetical protein
VTIAGVAFVPSAPLLVREVAGGSAALDEDLRQASLHAIERVTDAGIERMVVVAPTGETGSWDRSATWDFAGFGIAPRDVEGGRLPWPLGIGAWLLDDAGWSGERTYLGVTEAGRAAGEVGSGRWSVLAIGDGSACRTEKAPGHLDQRAAGFDESVAAALAAGDVGALARLDQTLATELMCAGLGTWRWLAGAVGDQPASTAELLTHDARYGVGYFVAAWTFG